MSLGKVSGVGNLGSELEGLTPEQIKSAIKEKFSKVYGRYENVSGRMWAELYHNEGDKTEGDVIWRKGTGDEITEELILEVPQAIMKFMELVHKGYSEEFKGVTQADIDKGNAMRKQKQSAPQREGWLGIYYKGSHFFRISQFKADDYYIEYGYDGCPTRTMNENEGGARYELDMALSKGFRRKGEEEVEFTNPMEAFGLELDTMEAQDEEKRLAQRASEPADGDLPDSFFEMMK